MSLESNQFRKDFAVWEVCARYDRNKAGEFGKGFKYHYVIISG